MFQYFSASIICAVLQVHAVIETLLCIRLRILDGHL